MTSNYFVMSRRYICRRSCCQTAPDRQTTFMGYNSVSRTKLPYGLGRFFPAFFTFRAGVDNSVISLMRALFDKGVRPESFAETILEMHSKKYHEDYLLREFEIERSSAFFVTRRPPMFSEFADKLNYAGLVPTGRYLAQVYKQYNATIKNHLEKEIKKQPCSRFHIDASYKEAKHLAQYHGYPLFKALVTVTNEFGAIRLQFHTVTDGHDQMNQAVSAFVNTAREYGQVLPEVAATDNPSRDRKWLYDLIPSLRCTQQRLDALSSPADAVPYNMTPNKEPTTVTGDGQASATAHDLGERRQPPQALIPVVFTDMQRVRVASSVEDINMTVLAVRQIVASKAVSERIISLDAEWDTRTNRSGQVVASFKTAVIQLGYRDSEGRMSALLAQVFRHQKLPQALVALFAEPDISFVGVCISGDLKRIAKDFKCPECIENTNCVNLGSHARKRDVVRNGTASLEKLVQLTLGEKLDKSPSLRLSRWSCPELCDAPKRYAALDVIKSLEVFEHLQNLPDLTLRLTPEVAKPNLHVDIVPAHGNVASMATRAAVGMLSDVSFCESPDGVTPCRVKANQNSRVVTLISLSSPSLIVPGLKKGSNKKEKVCLGDFGVPPFLVVLPLNILKHHVDSTSVRVFSDVDPRMSENNAGAATTTAPTRAAQPTNSSDHCDTVLDFSETDDRINDEAALDSNDFDEDAGAKCEIQTGTLTSEALDLVTLAGVVGDVDREGPRGPVILQCEHLDEPPTTFLESFSACLGDAYHAMSRPKVLVKHEFKKPYFVALQQAFFTWRPDLLSEVKAVLGAKGFSKQDIDAKMYYDVDFFRQRVDRRILPPRQLYWRVRSVYVLFGDKVDSKSKMPLFNKRAWSKANNVLKEILLGFYSDPPGISFYTNRLNKQGEPMVDQYGIALLDCNRGTNDVEAIHKQLVALYGTWKTGVQMSDALLSERRHRYNHKINERKRLGFPKFGHYDTWLVDAIQLLVEKNHQVLLYTEWSNASDYKDTPESFGTVALHSKELHEAVEGIKLSDQVVGNLSGEMKYLAQATGVKVPFLPLHGSAEAKLFTRLVLEMPRFDEFTMSLHWCQHVDGTFVFPKLPVYLRLYYERWERNQRVQDAVRNSKTELQLLEKVNNDNTLHPRGNEAMQFVMDEECTLSDIHDAVNNVDVVQTGRQLQYNPWVQIGDPTPMVQPHYVAIRPHQQLGLPTVGGLQIGLSTDTYVNIRHKTKVVRGKDCRERQKRTCVRCVLHSGRNGWRCNGRKGGRNGGQNACEYFKADGIAILGLPSI